MKIRENKKKQPYMYVMFVAILQPVQSLDLFLILQEIHLEEFILKI